MTHRRPQALIGVLAALCLDASAVVAVATPAPGQPPTEYEVKAVFLLNFA